jgi:1,5-anhydro-D-fructose reductase (1,5-anhydro-D-mannitol-forming)
MRNVSTSTRRVRWGIVGPGRIVVNQIAPALLASPGSEIVACAASSLDKAQAFGDRFGVSRCYADYRALVRDPNVDVVFVATPNDLHYPVVLAAANAGKHVLCEKPLAMRVDEGQAMVDACRSAGVQLRVGFYIRLEAIMERIRNLLGAGVIGRPLAISMARNGPALLRSGWRLEGSQGGALFDMAVHLLDLVEWLSGESLVEIAASSHPDRRDGLPDDTVAILGGLRGGCQVQLRASRETPHAANDLVIEGERGMIATSALRWSDAYQLRIAGDTGTRVETIPATPAYALELQLFERELTGEVCGLAAGEDGVRAIVLAEAVHAAIVTRRMVAV